jgi:hypothetical protein
MNNLSGSKKSGVVAVIIAMFLLIHAIPAKACENSADSLASSYPSSRTELMFE